VTLIPLAQLEHSRDAGGSRHAGQYLGDFIMGRLSTTLVLGTGVIAALLLSPTFGPEQTPGLHFARARAETGDAAEKAFAAAKELGTVEAWNAFLANYPSGFHADLARAYLKKLEAPADQPQTAAPAPAAPPPDDFPIVARSWGGIVRDGPGQSYRKVNSLEEGQEVTLMARTDVIENGYPWFKIAYEGDGKGYQWGGILCSAEEERPDLFKTCPESDAKDSDAEDESETSTKPKTKTKAATKRCSSGRIMIDGKCIEKGAAAGYCGPGYRPQGGKCVQGYQAPKANTPLSTEQRKAVNKGCPRGQVWNAQEGCHEDD
jgi:hypothetical protein